MDEILKYFEDLTVEQRRQLAALGSLYADWNAKINVISRKDIEGLYEKHVLHSLAIAAIFEFQPGMQVLDLGAGGGFPSIPLAIFFPEVQFLAVDSIRKKLTVVQEVADGAGINNIRVLHSRVEVMPYQLFDVVVSRAVAPLKDLLHWSKRLIRPASEVKKTFMPSGSDINIPVGLICLKGGDLGQEISESGRRPHIWPIETMFKCDYFKEKYVLQVK